MEGIEHGQYNLGQIEAIHSSPSSQLYDVSGNISVKDILLSSGVPQMELQKITGPQESKYMINEPKPNIINIKNIEYKEEPHMYDIRIQLQHAIQQILGNVASEDYIKMISTCMINKSLYGVIYSDETENVINLINKKIEKFVISPKKE